MLIVLQVGHYPAGSKASLQTAIDKAKGVANAANTTMQQVDQTATESDAAL